MSGRFRLGPSRSRRVGALCAVTVRGARPRVRLCGGLSGGVASLAVPVSVPVPVCAGLRRDRQRIAAMGRCEQVAKDSS